MLSTITDINLLLSILLESCGLAEGDIRRIFPQNPSPDDNHQCIFYNKKLINMKYFKYFILTTILIVGISLPSCDDDHIDCGSSPTVYFDVEGLEILLYQDFNRGLAIASEESVQFNDGKYIHLDYIVNYHTQNTLKKDWSFSLINSAYACSPIFGAASSKTENLVKFSIITLNDFDDEHLANSDITDQFEYLGYFLESEFADWIDSNSLTDHLSDSLDKRLNGEDMFLKLTKAPELNSEFKIKISMELSTGEIYEVESHPIFITP